MAELAEFPAAGVLDGSEVLPALQGGVGVKVTSAAIAGLARVSRGSRIAILGNSIGAGATVRPFDATTDAAWAGATAKAVGACVYPKCFDLSAGYAALRYRCTAAGTTGLSEPLWPQAAGGTVSDGSAVWTAEAATGGPSWGTGWWTFAQMLSGQRFDEVFLMARGGAQSPEILSYLPRALAASPDIVLLANVLDNDCWAGAAPTLATVQARWAAFAAACDAVRAAGKKLWLQTLLPSGFIDNAATWPAITYAKGNGTEAWTWLNRKLKEYARAHGEIELFDVSHAYIDPNPANPVAPDNAASFAVGVGSDTRYTDGIHPRVSAGWRIATVYAARMNAMPPGADRFGIAGETHQRMPNPMNHGTSGSHGSNVTPTSGVVPASMRLDAFGTGTVSGAASRVARTDRAGHWLQLVYNAAAGTADTVSYNASVSPALAPNAAGDLVQAFGEIWIAANPLMLTAPVLQARFVGGTPQWSYSTAPASADQDIGQMIAADTLLTLKTVPMAIPAGTTAMNVYAKANARGAAGFTVRFGRTALGRVSVPALV